MLRLCSFAVLVLAACAKQGSPGSSSTAGAIACERLDPFHEVTLSEAELPLRHQAGAAPRDLSKVQVSNDAPIEVCGVRQQLDWLLEARCADGSAPFLDLETAHAARVGNLGGGGRCGSVIDLYQVRCPEEVYAVYMDLYMCGPGESVH